MRPSFEIFDHTADAGIRIIAPSLAELVEPAGQGLYAVIGQLIPTDETKPITYDLRANDAATLLRDYLAELLILYECDARLVHSLEVVEFDQGRLAVSAGAAPVDDRRSVCDREVKAITYHQLDIRTIADGYEATIIVDI